MSERRYIQEKMEIISDLRYVMEKMIQIHTDENHIRPKIHTLEKIISDPK